MSGGHDLRLKTGESFGEVLSGIQKMIRRGLEREAAVLAFGMYESNFGAALARRLTVIAAEDIGLANPELVGVVNSVCAAWCSLSKDQTSGKLPWNGLMFCVIAMCRSPKSQEAANAGVWAWQMAVQGKLTPQMVIDKHEEVICDGHTDKGRAKLRDKGIRGKTETLAATMTQFYSDTGTHVNHVTQAGDPFTKAVCQIYGVDYEKEFLRIDKLWREQRESDEDE
jgi:replication-associated recombination protein RarA